MTTKRKEIFFNQVLAFDEIDRLFDKKALCKFTRHDQNGAQPVSGCLKRHPDGTLAENLIMKGNNLLALHSLRFLIYKKLLNKIKLIYIDPPYNTGNDGFKYNDKFNHSTWLTFMKNRLEIARELLADDGVIFVQCDYRENSYLRILMDEVFGRENFVNEITWKKYGGVKNQSTLKLTTQQETIYLYSKTENFKINKVYNPLSEKHIKNEYKYVDENGRRYAKLRGRNYQNNDGTAKIKYLDENLGSPITTLWIEDHLQLNTSDAEKLKDFTGQKPETLIQRIIELSTEPNDIVLDYHLGSGTTAAVAHKMGRQYIGIEQMDYIETLAVERLKKVIAGEQSGISKAVNWQGGGDFVYAELAPFNETAKQQILACENSGSLKTLFDTLCEKYFLKYNVNVNDFTEKIMTEPEFQNMPLDEQKRMVLEILDLNQMYVHFSEMDDAQFSGCLNENDKALNHDFYGE